MKKYTNILRTPFKKSLFDSFIGIAFIAGVSINFVSCNGTDALISVTETDTIVQDSNVATIAVASSAVAKSAVDSKVNLKIK